LAFIGPCLALHRLGQRYQIQTPVLNVPRVHKTEIAAVAECLLPPRPAAIMEPPSQREIDLEMLIRERDTQVAELTDELNVLKKYLSTQPSPSRTDPVSLPPSLLALIQPYLSSQNAAPDAQASGSSSSTMTAGLMQRVRILQEENDELYQLLRTSETGRLKEEVRCLKRVVSRLERALTDSNGVVSNLTYVISQSCRYFILFYIQL